MRFVFKVCRAVASSLPWDLPSRLYCDHMDTASIISEGGKKDKWQHGESLCQNRGRKKKADAHMSRFFFNTHMSRY